MTNFEKITETTEALGEFPASLPVADGPWDAEFHKAFCDNCKRENCDGKRCPHNAERGNPAWWLNLGGKPGEVPGLSIRVKAAFPILWGREYYTVAEKQKETRTACACCDNTGKVTIKGVEYDCPRCKGDWREKEVVGTTTVYSVAKWVLESISANQYGLSLTFKQTNSTERWGGSLQVRQADFHDMVHRPSITGKEREKMAKKTYPGGFRLTLATARKLAVQEFGTAKGLEPDRGTCLEGFFTMRMGNMGISISPDLGMSGCIVVRAGLCTASHTCVGYFDRETLGPDFDVMDKYERREKREVLETWVGDIGPDACHKRIDEVWERGRG